MRRTSFALTIILCFSCSEEKQARDAESAALDVLKILDINVWSGLNYEGMFRMGEYESAETREKRYQALVSQISTLNPDIIGVHEANKLPDYAERLASDLGFDVFYHVGVGGVRLGKIGLPLNLREGDAILTRPNLQGQFIGRKQLSGGHVGSFFTFHFEDATQVIAVKIMNKNMPLYLFATHWHASPLESQATQALLQRANPHDSLEIKIWRNKVEEGARWRMNESISTLAFIEKVSGESPFVLMGDFNATGDLPEIQRLLDAGMFDSFGQANPAADGFTWDPASNLNHEKHYSAKRDAEKDGSLLVEMEHAHELMAKRIDYIFVGPASLIDSPGISIQSSRVVLDEIVDGLHASDHFGMLTELKFE